MGSFCQKETLSANWPIRGSRPLRIEPNPAPLTDTPGLLKFAWLKTLKNSARILKAHSFPEIAKRLKIPISVLNTPGPRKRPLPRVPKLPSGGMAKAMGFQIVDARSLVLTGSRPIRVLLTATARSLSDSTLRLVPSREDGQRAAALALVMPLNCHPPATPGPIGSRGEIRKLPDVGDDEQLLEIEIGRPLVDRFKALHIIRHTCVAFNMGVTASSPTGRLSRLLDQV